MKDLKDQTFFAIEPFAFAALEHDREDIRDKDAWADDITFGQLRELGRIYWVMVSER